ncbi:MAG TPA: divergent polysaccharide deacetylase family protein [Geobacteraceae bacterium]|nr:divergent polysaccharide deacetylase family protein [Geobacteraceae bacterium]
MPKRRSKTANRRKKPAGKRPLLALLIVIALITLAFYLLETMKKGAPVTVAPQQPAPAERHKMPERTGEARTPARTGENAAEQQTYTTAAQPPPPKQPRKRPERPVVPGSVAIIVDDMGSSVQEVNELMAIKLPLTFSVIPGLAKGREVAQTAHAGGYQVMIHMPMEPQGYPKQRMEQNGLLLSQDDGEIRKRLSGFMQAVPYALGANNHMGSRFTEDREKMGTVLGFLKGKGFFFIDSKTSPRSVGYSLAREMGLATAGRNVFLDNEQRDDYIRGQLDQLVDIARRKGMAIGICHPHKATIAVLTAALPELRKSGISFVFVKDLVR